MIQSPSCKVIVEVKQKYIKNISSIMKAAAIENNSSVDPVELVNILGVVQSLPKTISSKKKYKGFSTKDIRVGDTAIFSYRVIYDFIQVGEDIKYKNLIKYEDKELFTADITDVFGVIRDGKIIMINGYVMTTPFAEKKIILAAASKQTKGTVISEVIEIGNPKETDKPLEVKQGDSIYYNPMKAQKYQINNKPFVIIPQSQVLGKIVA